MRLSRRMQAAKALAILALWVGISPLRMLEMPADEFLGMVRRAARRGWN